MSHTNQDLLKIMQDHKLSCADVAKALDVPLETVESWTRSQQACNSYLQMPEFDLKVLQYSLMTENTRYHLF
ncbi:MAG: hypothetical protein KZQ90_09380 [Candidatus Thiodiazotropha sp. (ex Codakia rugifera)]|nr:hypothetical protein [Candidatus Thiodiazotropha sp. (ex Codakia rugifera)]